MDMIPRISVRGCKLRSLRKKGGDAGRETSKMLQFKINPAELFHQSLVAPPRK